MPGRPPSLVSTSLWHTPHASTRIRTWPVPGVGISRSTISKSAPAFGTCATFIFGISLSPFSLPCDFRYGGLDVQQPFKYSLKLPGYNRGCVGRFCGRIAGVFQRLTERKEWKFFSVLPRAAPGLALAWWTVLLLRGILPAAFAIAMGLLVGAVQHGGNLVGQLALAGTVFVLLQVLSTIHLAGGANLGVRTAAWLYDRLTEACVRPPGMGHLEDPKLTNDLTVARDFDLGMTGPPLSISMDFIASGMVEMIGGVACAVILARYAWWAPIVLAGAWLATHWLLRESAIWHDRNTEEVRAAQRDADYSYRLAVDPPASTELRLLVPAGGM